MQEHKLIARFQNGDFESFGMLYEQYIDQIFAFIYRKTSCRETAEDINSQVWIKAMKALEKFSEKKGASFKSWIYTIANNTVIDYYRTQKEKVDIESICEPGISQEFAENLDNKDKLSEVLNFMKGLKSIEQEIVTLRIWDDLSYKEIAKITDKKEDNCKQIFKRSLQKIQSNIVLFILLLLIF